MEPIETIKFSDGAILEIIPDECPESPREWDNLGWRVRPFGTMVCFHRNYNLGDKHDYSPHQNLKAAILEDHPDAIILPLYLYDHSGITMNTTGFSCPWDSGQVGYIFVSREKIEQEYGQHGGRTDEEIRQYLRNEVAVYDQYLRGDVYGFQLLGPEQTCGECGHVTREQLDSCWGFYGSNPRENGISDHLPEQYRVELE